MANWLSEAQEHSDPNLIITLVGNKCDKTEDRQVSYQEGFEFAQRYNLQFVETSAVTGENVGPLIFRTENFWLNLSGCCRTECCFRSYTRTGSTFDLMSAATERINISSGRRHLYPDSKHRLHEECCFGCAGAACAGAAPDKAFGAGRGTRGRGRWVRRRRRAHGHSLRVLTCGCGQRPPAWSIRIRAASKVDGCGRGSRYRRCVRGNPHADPQPNGWHFVLPVKSPEILPLQMQTDLVSVAFLSPHVFELNQVQFVSALSPSELHPAEYLSRERHDTAHQLVKVKVKVNVAGQITGIMSLNGETQPAHLRAVLGWNYCHVTASTCFSSFYGSRFSMESAGF